MKKFQIISIGIMMMMSFSCENNSEVVLPQGGALQDKLETRSPSIPFNALDSRFSRGFGLNNHGVVAGSVVESPGKIVAFTLSHHGAWFSDEPVAPDGLPVIRFAINDRGDVTGHRKVTGGIIPVVWKKGVAYDLPNLAGYQYGEVFDINSSGLMVGEALNGNYVNPSSLRAVVFSLDGAAVDLGTLGGNNASAAGLNDKGEIVGFSDTPVPGHSRAFLYKDGVMTELGTLGGPWSNANAINSKGEIAGRSVLVDGFSIRGFLYRNEQMINIGTLGGNSSVATDINERSEIVGFSRISSGPFHAFIYYEGSMQNIGALLMNATDSRAMSINDNGDVTGYFTRTDGTTHAFLYRDGEMIEL